MKPILGLTLLGKVAKDHFLQRILCRCGAYYHPGDLFYQELWKQRLSQIGFRVLSVEKLWLHEVWDIRLCGNLTVQTYLLISQPAAKQDLYATEPLLKPIRAEIQRLARELGPPIKSDCLNVVRSGAYFRVTFIWPVGRPGRLLKKEKKAEAFSFLIRAWVRRNRN